MAGKRRQKGKPLVRTLRHERRATNLNAELAAAETLSDRVSIAAGYFRGALALNPDAAEAKRIEVELVESADRLYERSVRR